MRHAPSPCGATFRRNTLPRLEHLEDRLTPAGIDPVLEWNAIALQANAISHTLPGGTQKGPVLSARALAIQSAAVYDTVNSILPQWRPYLTVAPNARGASLDAAVAKASRDVLADLYPAQVALFDACLTQTLARVPNGPAENRGVAVGRLVAQRLLAVRANDHSSDNVPYTPGTDPGDWQPDPLHPTQTAVGPGHGLITPFAIRSVDDFVGSPPPALTSPEYAMAYQEVKMLGGDGVTTPTLRTAEQTIIGTFWGYDGSPSLGTPPRLYNQIARTVAIQMGNAAPANARLLALVNMAMTDAGIDCWDTKYDYEFWRPITAIRAGDADGNAFTQGDATWAPLGAPQNNGGGTNFTPPFPAYASGHATFGAATFRILRNFYGRDRITFTIGSDEYNGVTRDQNGDIRPVVFRTYTSFSQAAEENGQSRIYLGIHWAFDKTQGIRSGNAIADYVFLHTLQPMRGQALPRDTPAVPAASTAAPPAPAGITTTDAAFLGQVLAPAMSHSPVLAASAPVVGAAPSVIVANSVPPAPSTSARINGPRLGAPVVPADLAGASVIDVALGGFGIWRLGQR